MTAAAPPVLSAALTDGLRRLKLAAMRRLAPELLVTAKTQRWSPEELLRTLAHVDFLDAAITDLDTRLDQVRHPLQEVIDRVVTIPGCQGGPRSCCWLSAALT